MNNQQGFRAELKSRQQGAVAIIVALSLVALVGMLGLVLDLGHLYVTKTELQNASDAAALSGAKELNGRMTGINNAINRAIEAAGKNKYNLNSQALVITDSDIRVGACPSDGCMIPITSITTDALAADKTFLEVNTGSHGLGVWFAQVLSSAHSNVATSAVAVAGKYVADITPIAICGNLVNPGVTNELGFERGVSYRVKDANPLSNGTMYWIDAESTEPGECPVSNANASRPYICTGKIGITPIVGEYVNTNTGITDNQFESLDSRFGSYGPQGQCDPTTAPPDVNVREYESGASGLARTWMTLQPNRQSLKFVDSSGGACTNNEGGCKPVPYLSRVASDYGVLWSAYRPAGKTVADWATLYQGNTTTVNYPTSSSPYDQTSGSYFQAPSVTGVSGRRKLNLVIVDCNVSSPGGCQQRQVLGIGKFFMQKKANTDNELYVEFGGLLPTPLPSSDIKLYR